MRRLLALALLFALTSPAYAQIAAPILFGHAPRGSYTGPGDVVSGARAWYGLRGYNAAYATGSNNGVNIQVGGSTFDIKILASGNLDVATALADAGTSGTGSCTIASTTITCATVTSGGLVQYGNITGAGITYPAYITSVGGCTTNGCTATLNQAQTVGVAETITGYQQIQIRTWYDQSGASACSGPCNIGPSSGRTSYLIANCQNTTLPCIAVIGPNSDYVPTTGMTSTNTPVTYSLVASRTSNFTSFGAVISLFNATSGQGSAIWPTTTNKFGIFCSAVGIATASNSVVHAIQATAANASASVINVDGTETTGLNCGTGAASTVITLFNDNGSDKWQGGLFMEAGMWPSNLGATNRGLLCHNQFVYWGTGTSC